MSKQYLYRKFTLVIRVNSYYHIYQNIAKNINLLKENCTCYNYINAENECGNDTYKSLRK